MKLEEITSGGSIAGIEPSVIVTVVAVVPISPDAVQLIYKTPDGTLRDRLLGRADEDTISVAKQERPCHSMVMAMPLNWRSRRSEGRPTKRTHGSGRQNR